MARVAPNRNPPGARAHRFRADTAVVSKRWWGWTVVYVLVVALAFLFLNWILALFLTIMGLTLMVVGGLAGSWDDHSTFEQRELARARRRAEKRQRTAGARAKDRALWEQHQARKAAQEGSRD
jgi:hypothetical protein